MRGSSEAKRAFGVNPFLLSSNKCRPHLSTYITRREDGRGGASSPLFEKSRQSEAFLQRRKQAASRFHISREY